MSDIEPVRVPTIVDEPMDFTVIATNPAQMERSQKSLILWLARKLQAERELERDTKEQFDIALRSKWKIEPWKRRLNQCGERLAFYRKVKVALEAGYYIVPPFPMDVFAVRTTATSPRHKYHYRTTKSEVTEPAMLLAAGEGNYVSAHPSLTEQLYYERDKTTGQLDYGKIKSREYAAFRHAEVDFPFKMVKPIVMEETAKAMALKIFDQLGVLPSVPVRGHVVQRDPMICGQILAQHKKRAPITFFIAWWLDTRSI